MLQNEEKVTVHPDHEPVYELAVLKNGGRSAKSRIRWPDDDAFVDLSRADLPSDGRAQCTALAVCDGYLQRRPLFEQGAEAHIFFEFKILKSITGPVFGGAELHSDTGLVVHGKSGIEFEPPVFTFVKRGQRVRFHHVMNLALAPGEYTLGVGLGSCTEEKLTKYLDGSLTYESFSPYIREHARAVDAAAFTILFRIGGQLTHHGVADLPSNMRLAVVGRAKKGRDARAAEAAPKGPTVFHVTHWKAGSQWINKILHDCASERIVEPVVGEKQFLYASIAAGSVYPTVYVTKQQFDSVVTPPDSRRFVIIRDLRDTLISGYFSVKTSHPLIAAAHPVQRKTLESLDVEEGLLFLMDDWLPACARIQRSWLEAGEPLIKYEDLLADDVGVLEPILIDHCKLPVGREQLRKIIEESRFEQVTRGRPRGVEDIQAHERKAIAGDWQNHFTPRVKEAFKLRYGGLLVATGYERDLNW